MKEYQHLSIPPPRGIRLLKLVGNDAKSGQLSVEIIRCSLDDRPSFQALSYTWGSPLSTTNEESSPISWGSLLVVNPSANPAESGGEIRQDQRQQCADEPTGAAYVGITSNLRDALLCLAQHSAPGWRLGSLLWVDAVCINQKDEAEKMTQVAMMGDIYSQALRVIVWLGRNDSDLPSIIWACDELLPALRAAAEKHEDEEAFWTWLKQYHPTDPEFWLRETGILADRQEWLRRWKTCFRFYITRRWFGRAWIVQEAVLARQIVIYNGATVLSWEDVSYFAEVCYKTNWDDIIMSTPFKQTESLNSAPWIAGFGIYDIHLLRSVCQGDRADASALQTVFGDDACEHGSKRWASSLLFMLLQTRRRSCLYPEDKIWSIMGISRRLLPISEDDPLIRGLGMTASNLYTMVTSIVLEESNSLELLSFREDQSLRKIAILPSWVPDYSAELLSWPLPFGRVNFNASNGASATTNQKLFKIEGSKLTVLSNPVGTVEYVGRWMNHGWGSWDTVKSKIVESFLEIKEHFGSIYRPTGEEMYDVLWRTMIADCSGPNLGTHPAASSLRRAFDDLIESCITSVIGQRKEVDKGPSNSGLAKVHDEADGRDGGKRRAVQPEGINALEPELALEFANLAYDILPFRTIFRLREGYLGLGPSDLEEGDEVRIVQGATVPYSLRQMGTDARYSLVGECYVHGIMDGELGGQLADSGQNVTIQ